MQITFLLLPETSSEPNYSAHTEAMLLRDTKLQGRTLKWVPEESPFLSAQTVSRRAGDKFLTFF